MINTLSNTQITKKSQNAGRQKVSDDFIVSSPKRVKTLIIIIIIIIIIRPLTVRVVRGTTDDFTTSSLHFSLFFTDLWDLVHSRPVHSLMLSSGLTIGWKQAIKHRTDEDAQLLGPLSSPDNKDARQGMSGELTEYIHGRTWIESHYRLVYRFSKTWTVPKLLTFSPPVYNNNNNNNNNK